MSRLPGLMAGERESNPQRTVLETAALPIELLPYIKAGFRTAPTFDKP